MYIYCMNINKVLTWTHLPENNNDVMTITIITIVMALTVMLVVNTTVAISVLGLGFNAIPVILVYRDWVFRVILFVLLSCLIF
uniref:Uncharacterized protein n=1 Tax=Anguilla anguilla TaxID=7936 RepID=A0A0E9QK73_ANGAN